MVHNKSNRACLNFENVALKEGQSRSQWYKLSPTVARTKEIRQFPQC
ncbi:hypothetical protein PL9214290748 [Planktothrix tepida PCC 9214]|uniref:Uncharacterized protein n=1 Tax=Planktothrix tepida PCC 9214 TaxID=671072 RepID=A0A1J1LF13_9CYAN|nr:hypothetical protein PL9214290748 [Planktothrix tepida PCC 9214]